MKTTSLLLSLPLLLLLGACANVGGPSEGPADDRVQVNFENPANFTDVKAHAMDDLSETYLAELRTHLQRRARSYLAPNQTLTMTFTDFDMAGEFEPWRLRIRNVRLDTQKGRLMRSFYPPRAEFTWVLSDENGNIVREGKERLVDMSFDLLANFNTDSQVLYYEKQMLDDWMRQTLRRR